MEAADRRGYGGLEPGLFSTEDRQSAHTVPRERAIGHGEHELAASVAALGRFLQLSPSALPSPYVLYESRNDDRPCLITVQLSIYSSIIIILTFYLNFEFYDIVSINFEFYGIVSIKVVPPSNKTCLHVSPKGSQ